MINPTPGLSGRQILLLTLSAAVLVLPLVLVALWVYGKHQWADGQLASLEPRYARVLGMQQQQTEIQEALEQLQGIRAQHVYPGESDSTQTGNGVQQQLRSVMDRAGLSVTSSQVKATSEEGPYERISVSMTAEGPWPAVQMALASVRAIQPTIWVDDLQVNLRGSLQNTNPQLAPDLSAQFTVSIFRSKVS